MTYRGAGGAEGEAGGAGGEAGAGGGEAGAGGEEPVGSAGAPSLSLASSSGESPLILRKGIVESMLLMVLRSEAR